MFIRFYQFLVSLPSNLRYYRKEGQIQAKTVPAFVLAFLTQVVLTFAAGLFALYLAHQDHVAFACLSLFLSWDLRALSVSLVPKFGTGGGTPHAKPAEDVVISSPSIYSPQLEC